MGEFTKQMTRAERRSVRSAAWRKRELDAAAQKVITAIGDGRRVLVQRCEACPMTKPDHMGGRSCQLDPFVNIPRADLIPPKCPLRASAVSIALDPDR